MDEDARLRTNVIICTLSITCFFVLMSIVSFLAHSHELLVAMLVLGTVSATLFTMQFKHDEYKLSIAMCFGSMAMCMSVYFLYTGGAQGLNFMWLYIVPCVAIMVVDLVNSIIYNGIFVLLITLMLNTPVRHLLMYEYDKTFYLLFPISLVFTMLCIYISEIIRTKTRRRLVDTSAQLQAQAHHDPLTGAYNRRAFDLHLEATGPGGYVFALLDLDNFKLVNDCHGHTAGDIMLQHIVTLINESMPEGARLYRWGGEEFLLLAPEGGGEPEQMLEHICESIRNTPLPLGGNTIPMSVSIGAYKAGHGAQVDCCIRRADACLYAAKEGGRDQLVFNGGE